MANGSRLVRASAPEKLFRRRCQEPRKANPGNHSPKSQQNHWNSKDASPESSPEQLCFVIAPILPYQPFLGFQGHATNGAVSWTVPLNFWVHRSRCKPSAALEGGDPRLVPGACHTSDSRPASRSRFPDTSGSGRALLRPRKRRFLADRGRGERKEMDRRVSSVTS